MRASDTLYVACTRPPMKLGVTYDGLKANFIVTLLITTIVIQNPLGFCVGAAVHMAFRELCRIDPHFFRKWSLYYRTKAMAQTGPRWGGSRLQPSPDRISAKTVRIAL
jgi:type IV secretion system protein VirB3